MPPTATATPRTEIRPGAPAAAATPSRRAPVREGHRDRLLDAAAIALPAALALALCLYEIGSRSLWLDEAATVAIASQHGAAFGAALAHDGGDMLGYYALVHVLIGAFGSGPFVLRLPSALAAAVAVAAMSALALRLLDRRVALATGTLGAVSLSLVYWGQNARGYAPMVALVSGSFLALVALLEGERPRRSAWIGYVVLITAAMYAGLEAALAVCAQLVVVILWHRNRLRAVGAALLLSGLCCAPLAVLAVDRGAGQLFWVPPPSLETARQIAQLLASSGLQPSFYTSTGGVLLDLTGAVVLLAVWRTWALLRDADGRGRARGPALILAWLIVPLALDFLESIAGHSLFQARYLLPSLPAVALLLAWALLDRAVPRALGASVLVALIALRALQLAPSYGVSSEPWQEATAYVVARAGPHDCALFYPADNRMPFEYYLRPGERAPRSLLPAVPWGVVRAYVEDYATLSPRRVSQLPSQCPHVWLITSHEGVVGGPPVANENYVRFAALWGELESEYHRVNARMFGRARVVAVWLFAR